MRLFINLLIVLIASSPFLFIQSTAQSTEGSVRIVQLLRQENSIRRYPDALPSLLKTMNEQTNARFDTDPLYINSLTDERLLENPILYINCDEQPNLEFPLEERDALRRYMEQGGFVYLDAGIKASFLGADLGHSYAAWEERPEIKELFSLVLPEKTFIPLGRDHDLFRTFFKDCPRMKISKYRPIKNDFPKPYFPLWNEKNGLKLLIHL